MLMRHKIVTCLLLFGLLGSMTGCSFGRTPTAESLMENAFGENASSIDMDVKFSIDADVDMTEILQEDTTMNMSVDTDMNVKAADSSIAYDGTISIQALGMNMDIPMKSYVVDGMQYTYNKDYDAWVKAPYDGATFDTGFLTGFSTDAFTSYELVKPANGDTTYVVNGTTDMKHLSEISSVNPDELFTGNLFGEIDESMLESMQFSVTMSFDKESKNLVSMAVLLSGDSMDFDTVKFNDMSLQLTINQIGDVTVDCPEDVIENAVSESELEDVDPDFTVDDSAVSDNTDDIDSEMSVVPEGDNLSQQMVGIEYMQLDQLIELLSEAYTTMPSDDVLLSLQVFLNTYDFDGFAHYISLYDYWDEDEKTALAFMTDLGAFDDSILTKLNVNVDEIHELMDTVVAVCK